MSKRKVHFDDAHVGQGDSTRRFKEKHSLDSDEEDDAVEEKLDEDDIEGQEEGDVGYDDGIKITPFNMREEMEEGHFDKDGMYIFDKDKDKIKDEWMDNIDWQTIKEREDNKTTEMNDDDSDDEADKLDLKSMYSEMLTYLKPGETVRKGLRRLGCKKGKPVSSMDRWKAKKQKKEESEEDKQAAKDKEDFLTLTGLADKLLQNGNMDVYEMTYEKLTYELKKFDNGKERVSVPEKIDDDDALDMFADDIDKTETEKIGKDFGNADSVKTESNSNADKSKEDKDTVQSNEVMWEYKWEDKDDEEIHGPYLSSEMLKWSEDGYFKAGVFCRKAGTQSQFYTSKRIDFDLYT
ncbi:CD2 antigen cytoplasmic tail-binding protein 2 homolog isoform X4 [Ruditapes philippinarum]|uniref:CD2 antigen cytoplasmic tail-binding protein 2 homolog isoform X1 n=1 Tax=Ruditapes philippinarum TaxID=129788 RepID=UPI00295ADBE9|nr:CD2 antigen cytoplasmic tail-binding protein 2 homolog isoform X1 [Ruditapes philippinarum]XP_060579137.1 CD2 antigen cytoplasmic tail-binding protein 2 homolog isoform X3 [Ruditapes philippinarum]XP_060579138.1 CD2 antigen cytoplasmic tail-binding protein 2 homolog isoform X4 [Ruditapes philippinarum]